MKWSDLLQWEGSSLSQQAQGYEKSAELLANVRESLDAQLSSLTAHGRTVDAARSAETSNGRRVSSRPSPASLTRPRRAHKKSDQRPGISMAPP